MKITSCLDENVVGMFGRLAQHRFIRFNGETRVEFYHGQKCNDGCFGSFVVLVYQDFGQMLVYDLSLLNTCGIEIGRLLD